MRSVLMFGGAHQREVDRELLARRVATIGVGGESAVSHATHEKLGAGGGSVAGS